MSPDTVLVLIARGKVQARLAKAVKKVGGEVRAYEAPKPWEMHKWVIARAKDEGLTLDSEAAKTLVSAVGTGQQRLAREVEKLVLAAHPAATLTADEVEQLIPTENTKGAYDLADALIKGDSRAALAISERLLEQDDHADRVGSALAAGGRGYRRPAVGRKEGARPRQ